ncbi:MAG: low molecular weight phosphotyrosine protein phosphatase [Acidimicrobiales bacterium]|nr:low molecular weight phosphotyrosine protein phosphatase [Acidimicrobiales bacterium]
MNTVAPRQSADPAEPTEPVEPVVRVCFVCLGNICRSPTAEAVMRSLLLREGLHGVVAVESAGTGAWHVGEPPDTRAVAEARRRGVEMQGTARQFHPGDFYVFDLILAMDERNLVDLHDLAPEPGLRNKARLLREFDPARRPDEDADVPDPYYGNGVGFARVFDLVHAACEGLLDHLVKAYGLRPTT